MSEHASPVPKPLSPEDMAEVHRDINYAYRLSQGFHLVDIRRVPSSSFPYAPDQTNNTGFASSDDRELADEAETLERTLLEKCGPDNVVVAPAPRALLVERGVAYTPDTMAFLARKP